MMDLVYLMVFVNYVQRIVITVKSQYDTAHANFLIDDFYLRDFDYFHNTFKNLKYKVLDKFIKW